MRIDDSLPYPCRFIIPFAQSFTHWGLLLSSSGRNCCGIRLHRAVDMAEAADSLTRLLNPNSCMEGEAFEPPVPRRHCCCLGFGWFGSQCPTAVVPNIRVLLLTS
jgi:hypothetical protein